MAHDPNLSSYSEGNSRTNDENNDNFDDKILNKMKEIKEMRNKLKPFCGDEMEFDDLFEDIFNYKHQITILNTIATLPNPMWNYLEDNQLINNKNNNKNEVKLHLLYGHMISWYRNKSIADQQIMTELMKEKEEMAIEINELKNEHCFHMENDMIINKPNTLFDIQMQTRYKLNIKNAFDNINMHYNNYMNGEDRRIAILLEEHAKKEEILMISFYKFCIEKYDIWIKLGGHWRDCPEDNFES